MDVVKIKLQDYNIEWDGPIILVKEDKVTILSPFQILQFIESASTKVRSRIYNAIKGLNSREEAMSYLELLGKRLLSIKL